MSEVNLEKIKDRIAKLLRLAADASSPNEAAIAASRARKLMDQYQVEEYQLKGQFDEEFGDAVYGRAFAAVPSYYAFFAPAIASYNDCICVFGRQVVDFKKGEFDQKKVGKTLVFRGYLSDINLAVDMFARIEEAVNRLCKEYCRQRGHVKYPVGVGGKFKAAAFDEISRRLKEMTKERDQLGAEAGTSLVLFKEAKVREHFNFEGYTQKRNPLLGIGNDADQQAHQAGREAGRKVEITRQIQS